MVQTQKMTLTQRSGSFSLLVEGVGLIPTPMLSFLRLAQLDLLAVGAQDMDSAAVGVGVAVAADRKSVV